MKIMFENHSCCDGGVKTSKSNSKTTFPHFGEFQLAKWAIKEASDADRWRRSVVCKDLSGSGEVGVEREFFDRWLRSLTKSSGRDFAFENHGESVDKRD